MLSKREYIPITDEERTKLIGMILKYLRERKHMSQGQLCLRTGIKKSTYANYESGRHCPSIETLSRLRLFHEVTMDFITGESILGIKDEYNGKDINSLIGNLNDIQLIENSSKLATMFENIAYIKANIIRLNEKFQNAPEIKEYIEGELSKLF